MITSSIIMPFLLTTLIERFLAPKINKRYIINEEEQVKEMFNHIFEIYNNQISDYEYATERLSSKLTPSEMKKFQSLEGKNNKEKFKTLLNMI